MKKAKYRCIYTHTHTQVHYIYIYHRHTYILCIHILPFDGRGLKHLPIYGCKKLCNIQIELIKLADSAERNLMVDFSLFLILNHVNVLSFQKTTKWNNVKTEKAGSLTKSFQDFKGLSSEWETVILIVKEMKRILGRGGPKQHDVN